jgi:hypothetical protein
MSMKLTPQKGIRSMGKKLLWPHEIGRELGVSAATVRRMADAGLVEVIRDSLGRRRFKPSAVIILRDHMGLRGAVVTEIGSEPDPETGA